MPPSAAAPPQAQSARAPRLALVPPPPLRVADVTMFYGERSGGIRTYLDAKVAHARTEGSFEHHVIRPGARERHEDGIHELPSVRLGTANGYRVPLGSGPLLTTLAEIEPDVVLLHDPFWDPLATAEAAHRLGAPVVAVHHGSSELDARALPGPHALYAAMLRRWLRHAYSSVDAIMSVVDPRRDCGRAATIPLRLGLHPAFRPQPDVRRGDHTLYVGRLAREKGVFRLLEAAALSDDPWPLRFIGSGPARDALEQRAARLGISKRVSFLPFVNGRAALAHRYASARCVVMPGEFETFGLVALEAAASGARVVTCMSAPSARAVGDLADTFMPGDAGSLRDAIAAARAAPADPVAAGALASHHAWPRLFERELDALRELVVA